MQNKYFFASYNMNLTPTKIPENFYKRHITNQTLGVKLNTARNFETSDRGIQFHTWKKEDVDTPPKSKHQHLRLETRNEAVCAPGGNQNYNDQHVTKQRREEEFCQNVAKEKNATFLYKNIVFSDKGLCESEPTTRETFNKKCYQQAANQLLQIVTLNKENILNLSMLDSGATSNF